MLVMQNNKMHCVCVLGVLFSLIACAGASFTRRFALSARISASGLNMSAEPSFPAVSALMSGKAAR